MAQIVSLLKGGSGSAILQAVEDALAAAAQLPSCLNFGVVADGVTDNTDAINAAWATLVSQGRPPRLMVPPSTGAILVNGVLTPPAGAGLIGIVGKPKIIMAGSTDDNTIVTEEDFQLSNLTLEGVHSTSNYKIVLASTGALIENCDFVNWNSGIQITGSRNTLRNLRMTNIRGAGVRVDGDYNTIQNVDGLNVTLFLIYLSGTAAYNSAKGVWKKLDIGSLTSWQQENRAAEIAVGQFGLECVGITFGCHHNHVSDYYAEYTSDAAFSCSGYENVIANGRSQGCAGNGITMIGSRNVMLGLVSIGDKRAIGCVPTAGGMSKDNVAMGCVGIDNWYAAFTNERTQLRQWVAGSTAATTSTYVYYGLNVYRTSPAVQTYGTIPPTHITGTVSDGLVDWTWIASDPESQHADRNTFVGCKAINSGNGLPDQPGLPGSSGTGEDFYIATGSGAKTRIYNPDPVIADPVNPQQGDVWYNSATGKLRARTAGATIDVSVGGGGSGVIASDVGELSYSVASLQNRAEDNANSPLLAFERAKAAGADVTTSSVLGKTTYAGEVAGSPRYAFRDTVFVESVSGTVVRGKRKWGVTDSGGTDWTAFTWSADGFMGIGDPVTKVENTPSVSLDVDGQAAFKMFGGTSWQSITSVVDGTITVERSLIAFNIPTDTTISIIVGPANHAPNIKLRNYGGGKITLVQNANSLRLPGGANVVIPTHHEVELDRVSANIWQMVGLPGFNAVSTVAALPIAATAGIGARRMVTDANATTFASIVASGGTNIVPVYSDGTNWRIG